MAEPVRVLLVHDQRAARATTADLLLDCGFSVEEASSRYDLAGIVGDEVIRVAVVALDAGRDGALGVIEELQTSCPDLRFVVVGPGATVAALVGFLRSGCVLDYLADPTVDGLRAAVDRAAAVGPSGSAGADAETLPSSNPLQHMLDCIREGTFRLPSVGGALEELDALLKRPDVQIADVEGAIGADPAVAGGVLKVANSSYYRAGAPVTSLRSACMRLGIPRVLALAREAVVASLLPKAGGVAALADEVWDRGVVARRIARDLAPKVRLDADTVADVMLLHDVGELALLRVLGDVLGARKLDEGEEREVRRILARNHEAVGALVLKSWGMPGELVRLAVCHHGSAPTWTEGAQEARLRALVRICDQAAEQTLGDHDQDPDEVALEALGLPMSEVTRVCIQVMATLRAA